MVFLSRIFDNYQSFFSYYGDGNKNTAKEIRNPGCSICHSLITSSEKAFF